MTLIRTSVAAVGGALDALIRSVRIDAGDVNALATRAVDGWRAAGLVPLDVEVSAICIGSQVTVAFAEQRGWWIPLAFMAGVRRVTPRADCGVDDLRRLAERLAILDTSAASMTELQAWIWSDGAEGFDIEIQPSFVEMLDDRAGQAAAVAGWNAIRTAGLETLAAGISVPTSDLDRAALRPEMHLALDRYSQAVKARETEVNSTTWRELACGGDDAAAWTGAEIAAVLRSPALQAGFPAERLARRIGSQTATRCDARLLLTLASIATGATPYERTTWSRLLALDLGRAIARGVLDAGVAIAEALAPLLEASAELRTAIVVQLLEDDRASAGALIAALARLRAPGWILASIAPAALTQDGVRGLARAHRACDFVVADVELALAVMSTDVTGAYFQHLEPAVRPRLPVALARLVAAVSMPTLAELVAGLPADLSPIVVDALLGRLVRDRGAGWSAGIVADVVERVAPTAGRAQLVRFARDRRNHEAARLAVLAVSPRFPALHRAVVRWRPSELLETADLRLVIRRARRRSTAT